MGVVPDPVSIHGVLAVNAIELLANGEPTGAWMCSKCRQVISYGSHTHNSELAKNGAERCCGPCERCGKARGRYTVSHCDSCRQDIYRENAAKLESERYAKARKLTVAEFLASDAAEHMLYHDAAAKWFRDLEEAEDYFADDDRARPEYLWIGKPADWEPCVSDDIGGQMDDQFHEDAASEIDSEEWKRLDAFVGEWWSANRPRSFTTDYSRCVLLGEASHQ